MRLQFELLVKVRISSTDFVITVLLLLGQAGGSRRGDGDYMKLICVNGGKYGFFFIYLFNSMPHYTVILHALHNPSFS